MTEKEKTIQLYMRKLDLSREEAEQMWLDEQEDNLPDLTPEQKAVVKEMTQADRKKESTPRKRERKVDESKREIIQGILDSAFFEWVKPDVKIINPERQIDFVYNGETYRLVLSKPRKEKTE